MYKENLSNILHTHQNEQTAGIEEFHENMRKLGIEESISI